MKTKKNLFLYCIILLTAVSPVKAQYIADWGKYVIDAAGSFGNTEYVEQMATDVKDAATNDEYVYMAGYTEARTNSETQCGTNTFNYGAGDAFLAKFSKCGDLIWFRYIGFDIAGTDKCADKATCVAVTHDASGNSFIYVAGNSNNCNATESVAAFDCSGICSGVQTTKTNTSDAFIAKYDEFGNLQKWTYFGGDDTEYVRSIDVYEDNVFICGYTESSNSFVSGATTSYDNTPSANGDAFMAQFDGNLCTLKYFTFMGGSGVDRANALKVFRETPTGPVYIYMAGTVSSSFDAALYGTYKNSYLGGSVDAFISLWKFNVPNNRFEPVWNRYVGGSDADRGREIALSPKSGGMNVILTGYTESSDLISATTWSYPTSNFKDIIYNGNTDAYAARFTQSGGAIWGTYLGGSNKDLGQSIRAFDVNSNSYVVIGGSTNSTDFPLTNHVQNALNDGINTTNSDAFATVLLDPKNSSTAQTMDFSTFFGGKKNEASNTIDNDSPRLTVGAHNEIYLNSYTKSADSYITSAGYHTNITSNAGTDDDIFLAKILNGAIANQFDCSSFAWKTQNADMPGTNMSGMSVTIFPNPAVQNVNILIHGSGNCLLQIFDASGAMAAEKRIEHITNQANFSLDVSSLAPGIYFVKCEMTGIVTAEKFVIER